MADNNQELQVEDGGSGKKKLLIIIAVVVILAAAGGWYFFMGSSSSESAMPTQMSESTASANSGSSVGTASYVAMPRPFIFNVPGSVRDRLVQIKVQLLVRGSKNEEMALKHIPLIEGTLLRAFSGANADDLATTAGKEALKLKALKDVQEALRQITGSNIIEKVLFTGFVMQ